MKIVIPGGSGHIGPLLSEAFLRDGHDVVVLSRRPDHRPWRVAQWDGRTAGAWWQQIDGADVVINLAGRSVNCRYTACHRREILESRVQSTAAVGEAIAAVAVPPRVWLQASTATIYSHRYDAPNDEICGAIGGGESNAATAWHFSVEVATAWERALADAVTPRTRKVAMRTAMTMHQGRGTIFGTLLELARKGLGDTAGEGRQFVSWIHHQDFVRAIRWLIAHDNLEGPVNLASPNPLPQREFMRELRRAAGVRVGLPVTRWMLEIGAVFLRTETELILKSRRVVPRRLLESGFTFDYPCWRDAVRDLCGGVTQV